jgi:hypothetical protein
MLHNDSGRRTQKCAPRDGSEWGAKTGAGASLA